MFFELAPDVVVRGHVLPPPFACSHTNGGLNERTFDASQARPVVLDRREHAFIDGRGRHAIACAGSRARQAGRQLGLVRVPSGSHFRERVSPRTNPISGNRHDPVDRGARKGSTS